MTLDYESHPSDLAEVEGGAVQGTEKKDVTIGDLKKAIPAHCFKTDWFNGPFLLTRDLVSCVGLGWLAYNYIPLIRNEGRTEYEVARYAAWLLYGYIQGMIFTGIWVQGHEAGHGVLTPSNFLNDALGFFCHSVLLTPYFSWQSTHRRHHIYANNLAKDHNYVPPKKEEYASFFKTSVESIDNIREMIEDAPVVVVLRVILQQFLGWPTYLINNITASEGSLYRAPSKAFLGNSHFLPWSTLFRPEEGWLILASDAGVLATAYAIYAFGQHFGLHAALLLYIQPYIWLNSWIVAITFVAHTHPTVPKYDPEAWTFIKGALATMDRNLGWVGKHLMHNITDYHVIHHLFSRIPQYHAEEATKAIMPVLGDQYKHDKNRNFWIGVWEAFTVCQWVKPDDAADEKERAYWFQDGPIPPPERNMKNRSWS